MKQHITEEQLEELTDKGKKKLREWWKPKKGDWYTRPKTDKEWKEANRMLQKRGRLPLNKRPYHYNMLCSNENGKIGGLTISQPNYPLLSIGQMIEFLDESQDKYHSWSLDQTDARCEPKAWSVQQWECDSPLNPTKHFTELCDCLWEACKEILNS